MDENTKDLLEAVNFIKDRMATKDDIIELEKKMDDGLTSVRKEMKDGFMAITNRMGAIDNRIDDESARRQDLENRVRIVLPNLSAAPERV